MQQIEKAHLNKTGIHFGISNHQFQVFLHYVNVNSHFTIYKQRTLLVTKNITNDNRYVIYRPLQTH